MQIIILLLQGISSLHGGGCQGANGRLDSPPCPPLPTDLSEAQYNPSPPVWQEWPGACDPYSLASVALAGLIWKQHRNGRVRRHWRPQREDRSLLLRPSKRAPHCAAAFLHSITLGTGRFSCLLSIFTDTLHSYGGPKALVGPDFCSPETQPSYF